MRQWRSDRMILLNRATYTEDGCNGKQTCEQCIDLDEGFLIVELVGLAEEVRKVGVGCELVPQHEGSHADRNTVEIYCGPISDSHLLIKQLQVQKSASKVSPFVKVGALAKN